MKLEMEPKTVFSPEPVLFIWLCYSTCFHLIQAGSCSSQHLSLMLCPLFGYLLSQGIPLKCSFPGWAVTLIPSSCFLPGKPSLTTANLSYISWPILGFQSVLIHGTRHTCNCSFNVPLLLLAIVPQRQGSSHYTYCCVAWCSGYLPEVYGCGRILSMRVGILGGSRSEDPQPMVLALG